MLVPQNPQVDPARAWALEFDGAHALIMSEKEVSLGTGPWTVGGWYCAGASTADHYPHFLTSGTDQGDFACKCTKVGKPYFYAQASGSIMANTTMDLTKWNHVTYVYDGSEIKIYINGVLDRTSASSLGLDIPTTQVITQGGNREFAGGFHAGTWLFNRALSEREIKKFATSRLTGREPGLLIYWPYVEGQGEQLTDWSLNRNHGLFTEYTYAVATSGSSIDSAVRFGTTSLPNGTNFTIEFWLYISVDTTGQEPYLSLWDGSDAPFLFDAYNSAFRFTTAGMTLSVSKPSAFSWVHVAGVFDASEPSGDHLKLYFDGSLAGSSQKDLSSAATYAATLWMGRKQDSQTALADCTLTEIRFWDHSRTQAEIQDNMNRRMGGWETGLYIHYPFSEAGGDIVAPSTNLGNEGQIGEDAAWTYPYQWGDVSKRLWLNGPFPRWVKHTPP